MLVYIWDAQQLITEGRRSFSKKQNSREVRRSLYLSGSKGLPVIFAFFFFLLHLRAHHWFWTPMSKLKCSIKPDMNLVAKVLWKNAKNQEVWCGRQCSTDMDVTVPTTPTPNAKTGTQTLEECPACNTQHVFLINELANLYPLFPTWTF